MPQHLIGRLLRLFVLSLFFFVGCTSNPDTLWTFHEYYQERSLHSPIGEGNGFTEIPNAIAFSNHISASALITNRHVVNGSGVSIGDIDGDGLPDIFLAAMEHRSTLHRNLGDWKFEDITLDANLGLVNPRSTGAAFVDIDADEDLDLLVTSLGSGIQLFVNDGLGQFTDFTDQSSLSQTGGATSMALADIDGDRDLDLYVGFYKEMTVKDIWPPQEITFERVVEEIADSFAVREFWEEEYQLIRQGDRLMRIELAEPDQFFYNEGQGYFSEGSFTDGSFLDEEGNPLTEAPRHWTLAVRFQDLNNDGYPDLYVCNDFESPDQLWWGTSHGGFKAASTLSLRKTSQSTMSATAADINADGHVDLFLADMLSSSYTERQRQHFVVPPEILPMGDIRARPQEMQNMLLLNRGDSTFAETARMSGIEASGWTWSSSFTDVDLDGFPDLLLTTGHAYDAMDADAQIASRSSRRPWREVLIDFPDLDLPNIAFRNLGNMRFERVEDGWGIGLTPDVAHGMALADLDQDGDQDLIINRLDHSVGVFRNNAESPRILIRLLGRSPNSQGIGSKVHVVSPGFPPQSQEVLSGGLYLSSSDAALTFAYFEGAEIIVRWPNGQVTQIDDILPDREYWINQPETGPTGSIATTPQKTFFNESLTGLHHQESSYPDFYRQPLLPHKLSQRGPALAVVDIDSDGDEDLILGGGKGMRLQFSLNEAGRFVTQQFFGDPSKGDHSGIVTISDQIITGSGNYERSPQDHGDASTIIRVRPDGTEDFFDLGQQSPGPLTLGDFTGNGSLEVFVGGHFIPGQYPLPANSAIFRMDQGKLIRDDSLSASLKDVGIVSGATAVDLNRDGRIDLALAVMWGPPRIYYNQGNGQLLEMTRSLGLSEYVGWWNGIAPADFDGDGMIDLVVTNWGQNLPYNQEIPLRAYYGDLDNNSTIEIIEVQRIPELDLFGFVRDFRTLTYALPSLRQHVQTYTAFSTTSFEEIFEPTLRTIHYHEVTHWETTVFLNRGSSYEAVSLPIEAQMSPAFAAVPGDFNGDGRTDLFLSQNFFEVPTGSPRLDSGRGLLLISDQSNRLEPATAQQSGIQVYGSQRAAVAADFNLDGRLDLAVTQNAGPVVQYENQTSAVGLRVALFTSTSNTQAIGSTIRPEYHEGTLGPVTSVVAGSGYWSQSSVISLIGSRSKISKLRVDWPDGRDTTVVVPPDVQNITIRQQ